MTRSLWFVVPAHGRQELAAICLRQLRRTCDALAEHDIDASAVVVADDENLDTARDLGFASVERDNKFTSRKFNDGIQLALDDRFNPRPAEYVVPCGSDDWVHPDIFVDLPDQRTIVGFQRVSFVREDGREIMTSFINYPGGSGIRIYPRELLRPLGFRPGDEDRCRGCDTSILVNLRRHYHGRLRIEHRHHHDRQIVDWKTTGAQLNEYAVVSRYRNSREDDPFLALAGFYPDEALEEMRAHYGARVLVAA